MLHRLVNSQLAFSRAIGKSKIEKSKNNDAPLSLRYPLSHKKSEKLLKPWHMGTHLRALSESFLMNTNMTGFGWFSKLFASCFGRK